MVPAVDGYEAFFVFQAKVEFPTVVVKGRTLFWPNFTKTWQMTVAKVCSFCNMGCLSGGRVLTLGGGDLPRRGPRVLM